jgi:uncharacterized protein (TIGR00369 family)
MEVQDPQALERVRQRFLQAAFVIDLGIELLELGPGWADTALLVAPRHYQAERFIHAGVQSTLADHCAGSAAATLMSAEQTVVTVEYKINFLKPAVGARLRCRADVLRPGKTLSVAESKVYVDGQSSPVAVALLTLAVIAAPPAR